MEDDRENTVNNTDGSVNQQSDRAGAAFLCECHLHSTMLSNGSSILKSELYAIKSALAYALSCTSFHCTYLIHSLLCIPYKMRVTWTVLAYVHLVHTKTAISARPVC